MFIGPPLKFHDERGILAMRAATRLGETAMPCTATSSACTRDEP